MPTRGEDACELLTVSRQIIPYFVGLAWSPDEHHLFWNQHVREGGLSPWPEVPTLALWRISVEGGEPPKLDIEMNELRDITVHPDGKHISFTAGNPAHAEVWVLENFLPKPEVTQAEQ